MAVSDRLVTLGVCGTGSEPHEPLKVTALRTAWSHMALRAKIDSPGDVLRRVLVVVLDFGVCDPQRLATYDAAS